MPQIINDYDKGVSLSLLSQKYNMSAHSIIKLVHYYKVEVPYEKAMERKSI